MLRKKILESLFEMHKEDRDEIIQLFYAIMEDFDRKGIDFTVYSTALIAAGCQIRAINGVSTQEIADALRGYADAALAKSTEHGI
jgi:hypothetical protein